MADTLISVDLSDSPHTNENVHNRWHPDIEPVLTVAPGESVRIETRDAAADQVVVRGKGDRQSMIGMRAAAKLQVAPVGA